MNIGSVLQDAGSLDVEDGFFCSICDSCLDGVSRIWDLGFGIIWDLVDSKAPHALRIGISWGVNAVLA